MSDFKAPKHKEQSPELQRDLTGVEVRAGSAAIPLIDILKFCEDVAPGTVDGTVKSLVHMAREQQKHRQSIELLSVQGSVNEVARGQMFAFLICLFGLLVGGFLILQGHDIYGTILGGSTLVGLASVFITGRRSREKEDGKE